MFPTLVNNTQVSVDLEFMHPQLRHENIESTTHKPMDIPYLLRDKNAECMERTEALPKRVISLEFNLNCNYSYSTRHRGGLEDKSKYCMIEV